MDFKNRTNKTILECPEITDGVIVEGVIDVCIVISIVSINSFIIYAVGRKWLKDGIPFGQESSTIFLLNLSLADTFIGLCHVYLVLPYYSCSVFRHVIFNFTPCIMRYSMSVSCHYASNLTMLTITVDRYLSVTHPVRYRDLQNTRRALITVAVIWIVAFNAVCSLFYWNIWEVGKKCETITVMPKAYSYCILLLLNLVVVSTIIFATWRIHKIVLRLRERNKPLTIAEKVNTKTFRVIVNFLVIYIITWTPYSIVTYMTYDRYKVPSLLVQFTYSITKVNYIANPFIFAYHMRLPRIAMVNVLRSLRNQMPMELSITSSPPISDTAPNRLQYSSGSFSIPPIRTTENQVI